jgi:hypothetical protein
VIEDGQPESQRVAELFAAVDRDAAGLKDDRLTQDSRILTHRPKAHGEMPHISWQTSAATAQRLATQTETPQVSSMPLPQIRWQRTRKR